MIREILHYGADVLHRPAQPVVEITADIHQLVDDLIQTMYAAPGIGLAAPQVGVPLRIFVVDLSVGRNAADLMTFINPEFVERDGMQLEEEGCLSLPGFNATVARPARAIVEGLDREGKQQTVEGTGLLAARSSTRWITSKAPYSSTGCEGFKRTSSSARSGSSRAPANGRRAADRLHGHTGLRRANTGAPARDAPRGGGRGDATGQATWTRSEGQRRSGKNAGGRTRPAHHPARAVARTGGRGGAPGMAPRSRRRCGIRQADTRCHADDPTPGHDQRARLSSAEISRSRADPVGDHQWRNGDGRDDHAGHSRARRRSDVREGRAADRLRRDE